MSNMKCPFCNRIIHKGEDNIYRHLDCMTECKARLFDGSKELWQELIRTRKALNIAVDALKLFDSGQYTSEPDSYGLKRDASRFARKIIAEITALEQKN